MIKVPGFRFIDWLMVLLVFGVAIGVRGWYMSEYADSGDRPTATTWYVQDRLPAVTADGKNEIDVLVGNMKQRGYLEGFRSVAPLSGAEENTAHVAPGYAFFRNGIEDGAGRFLSEQITPLAAVRWVQVALGSLAAALYFAIARRAFASRLVAMIAGMFCALNPFWIINCAEMNDGTLATFMLAFTLALGVRAGQRGGRLTSYVLGLSLAGLALVRAAYLPFSFIGILWYMLRSRTSRIGWLDAFLAILGFGSGLAPWCIRNYQEFEQPVPIVTTAWYELWVGNNANATGGPLEGNLNQILGTDRIKSLGLLKQHKRYDALAQDVVDQVIENPLGTIERKMRSAISFYAGGWLLGKTPIIGRDANSREPCYPFQVWLHGMLFAMLLLGVWGWRWSYAWRRESMPLQLAVFFIPLPYILGHAEYLHGLRLPLDGPLMCLAAVAVVCLIPGIGSSVLNTRPMIGDAEEEPLPEGRL